MTKEGKYFPRVIREATEIIKRLENVNREEGYPLHSAWKRIILRKYEDVP
jgi:hypothetical protein